MCAHILALSNSNGFARDGDFPGKCLWQPGDFVPYFSRPGVVLGVSESPADVEIGFPMNKIYHLIS